MESWWQHLTILNKAFAVSAFFFSLLFLWQLAGLLLGMDGDSHGGAGHIPTHDAPHYAAHGAEHGGSNAVFSLISVRSVVAFGMLFSCAGALYLMGGTAPLWAVLYSLLWGLVAMFVVSYLMFSLLKLQETPKLSLWSAVGERGTIYMNVPENGMGKVRVMARGAISFVNARSMDGQPLMAGTEVRVVDVVDDNTLSVQATEDSGGE
jgi:membrane protein implicated in regulation of membrane protease activity